MIINVKQIEVTFDDCKYDVDLQHKVEAAGIYMDIVAGFSITSKSVIFYVEISPLEGGFEMELPDDNSGLLCTGSYITDLILLQFPDAFIKTTSVGANAYVEEEEKQEQYMDTLKKERNDYIRNMRTLVDYYIDSKVRIPLHEIEFVGGGAQIFKNDNTIVLLLDKYELTYDPTEYNFDDGTITIKRTQKIRDGYFEQNEEIDIEQLLSETKELESLWEKLEERNRVQIDESHRKDISIMKNLIQMFNDSTEETSTMHEALKEDYFGIDYNNPNSIVARSFVELRNSFDDIENDVYTATVQALTEQDIEIEQMRTFIDSVKDEGQTRLLTSDGAIPLKSATYAQELETVVDEEISTEELDSFTKGYRNTTTIVANVETISFDKFDDMAEKYHIVGWDLSTPNTLSIKFIEGTTPESTIKKFHDMMNSLDSGWVNTAHFNSLKNLEESAKFLAELRNVINDDTDVAQEFVNRVKKHNIFVRETMAKMRTALLDMENDFERVLKDEVNLNIDWETLTAFAAKKERTVTTQTGVHYTTNPIEVNIVRVSSTDLSSGEEEFYIPLNMVTNEIREKYVFQDEALTIQEVPDFAFYQTKINGHFLLIEKTDL